MPEPEIIGWIFYCDLCGFHTTVNIRHQRTAIVYAEHSLGWIVHDGASLKKDLCPKCVRDIKDPPSAFSGDKV